jgi:hypothetical protein
MPSQRHHSAPIGPSAAWRELDARRAFVCRLTPDRALTSLEEATAFVAERGLLTLTPDCALPSLFGACHEEPYQPGGRGFATWPRTKWWWGGALAEQPGIHRLRIHCGKGAYLAPAVVAFVDPLCRAALTAAEAGEYGPEAVRLVAHLAGGGPAELGDLKRELALGTAALRVLRDRLEPVGVVVSRAVMIPAAGGGERESSELDRWDQRFPERTPAGQGGLAELLVAGVRAAVLAPAAEVRSWFTWGAPADTLERLLANGHLWEPAPGWLACAA